MLYSFTREVNRDRAQKIFQYLVLHWLTGFPRHYTKLANKAYVGNSKINSAKMLHPVGIEPVQMRLLTLCVPIN